MLAGLGFGSLFIYSNIARMDQGDLFGGYPKDEPEEKEEDAEPENLWNFDK